MKFYLPFIPLQCVIIAATASRLDCFTSVGLFTDSKTLQKNFVVGWRQQNTRLRKLIFHKAVQFIVENCLKTLACTSFFMDVCMDMNCTQCGCLKCGKNFVIFAFKISCRLHCCYCLLSIYFILLYYIIIVIIFIICSATQHCIAYQKVLSHTYRVCHAF